MKKSLSKFFYILGESKSQLLVLFIAILFNSLLETVGIGLVGPFMSLITSPQAIDSNVFLSKIYPLLPVSSKVEFMGYLGLTIVAIFYFKSALKFLLQRYIFRFGYNNQGQIRLRLLKTYMNLPYTFHLKNNTANYIQNIIEETKTFANGVLISSMNATVHFVVLLALISLLIATDALATVVVLTLLLLVFAIYYFFKDKIASWGKMQSQANTETIRIVNHSLGGIKETKVIGCESYFLAEMKKQSQIYATAMSSLLSFKIVPLIIVESFIITFLIGFTSLFILSGRNTDNLISVLSIFALASIRIIPTVNQLTSSITAIRNANYSFNKLYYDLREIEKIKNEFNSEKLKDFNLAKSDNFRDKAQALIPFEQQIRLEHISYRYPTSQEFAITDISLTIKRGQSIALIGKSGAGKTTLVDIILGLLKPQRGDVRVDGQSIYDRMRSWQNIVGYIPQSIFLIDDTLEKNVAFGVPEAQIDPDRLKKAIAAAQLTDLVEKLPDGIQTQLGERGVRLSGGQRQRVGIARALYHEREILVLDEATSALDNETENLITQAIAALSGEKTLIIIAHRLTTVAHCDQIYVLEQGKMVESGSYQEVVLKS